MQRGPSRYTPIPPDGVLVDNSVLSAFGSIRRIDLLTTWIPLFATDRVLREARASGRGAIVSSVKRAEDEAWLYIVAPAEPKSIERILEQDELGQLSRADAELLALAETHGVLLLADDRRMETIGARLGVEVLDVVTILLALKQNGLLAAREVRDVVQGLEREDNRTFGAADRAQLLR